MICSYDNLNTGKLFCRVSLDLNTGLRNELLQQEEYVRRTLAAGFVKEPSGMTANKGTQSKRGYKELRRDRELVFTGEDVEWGGGIRGYKRREVSIERESRSGGYTEKDHQLVQSGSSDLTTEQSAVCMAAESNSTRTTGSFDEDGCLLKLQSAAPAAAGYAALPPNEEADFDDEEDDNSSMPLPNAMQAACVSYDVHRPAACASLSCDNHIVGQDWLGARSYHDIKRSAAECASYDQYQQNNATQGEDWLQLRLGGSFSVPHASSSTSSPASPCTLQLLPQEPDCALMKEREKHRKLKLCSGDYTRKPLISKQAEQARSPLVLPSYLQTENTTENPQNFYTSLMKASCLPLPPADSIGQYIATPAKIAAQCTRTADASLYPTLSPLDHHTSHYIQHLQQLQESNVQYRAPLHASQEQRAFESMSPGLCPSLQEAVQDAQEAAHIITVSRSPLPDFVHQNWDQVASPSPACSIMQPVTSFRDLIASSFLKEPSNRYDNSIPLLASLQQPASSHMWSAKCSQNSSPSDHNERINANTLESNYINNYMNMGCKSMTSWLSQALAATENMYVDQKLDDQLSPDASLAPSLSRKQINAQRKLAKNINKSSNQPHLKCISRPTSRGSPGFWFALQPSQTE